MYEHFNKYIYISENVLENYDSNIRGGENPHFMQ